MCVSVHACKLKVGLEQEFRAQKVRRHKTYGKTWEKASICRPMCEKDENHKFIGVCVRVFARVCMAAFSGQKDRKHCCEEQEQQC